MQGVVTSSAALTDWRRPPIKLEQLSAHAGCKKVNVVFEPLEKTKSVKEDGPELVANAQSPGVLFTAVTVLAGDGEDRQGP